MTQKELIQTFFNQFIKGYEKDGRIPVGIVYLDEDAQAQFLYFTALGMNKEVLVDVIRSAAAMVAGSEEECINLSDVIKRLNELN